MKKRKIKLFASLTSLVMVVAVMAVGIWAATGAKVAITSNASFSATGVSATITGNVNGANETITEYTQTFDASTENATTAGYEWEINTLTFKDANSDGTPDAIKYTITVENKATTNGTTIYAYLTDLESANHETDNLEVSIQSKAAAEDTLGDYPVAGVVITPTKTATFVITATVKDPLQNVAVATAALNFDLELFNAAQE